MTMLVSLAGIAVSVDCRHAYLAKLLEEYRCDGEPLFSVCVTQQMIDAERADADGSFSDDYLESLAFYRAFCTAASEHGVVLFHSCALEADGRAYLFAAPSGTGKTTHAALWKRVFGDRVKVLNGDKPLLRFRDGVPTVFGTPFMGKENLGYNGAVPIGGICFLERGAENSIRPLKPSAATAGAVSQLFVPKDGSGAVDILKAMFEILNAVPLWRMACNISDEAAIMSFRAMTGEVNL